MWWQIIPSAVICCSCLYAPQIIIYVSHNFFLGTPYLRSINKNYEAQMFLRDHRLTGNVYKQNGLDCFIPEIEPEYVEECIPVRKLKEPQPKPDDDD